VPIAVKDNICTKGVPTTAGSQILQGYLPPYNATAVSRLQAAGAVIIGKTNMDEFGMGSTTENSSYHISRNAWSSDHVPGAPPQNTASFKSWGHAYVVVQDLAVWFVVHWQWTARCFRNRLHI
jgi:aspartyl-tRNA(Asn)/glutamyl-tRNA(Gln) amidotransferase subunit A